jgi:hypothetical protein
MLRQSFCHAKMTLSQWRRIARHRQEGRTWEFLQYIEAKHAERVKSLDQEFWRYDWLLPYRTNFRRVIDQGDAATIQIYLASCPEEMRPLGIWLLGQCANRFVLFSLPACRWDSSPNVRKHVAKALWQLQAWHLLDEMATEFPADQKVRWYARVRSRRSNRSFGDRLRSFSPNVEHSRAAEIARPSHMPFWSRFDPWEGRPPRNASYIRSILERIRRWVHGH